VYSRRRNRFGERTKKKADGQRKWDPQKGHKGEHKREDTKGRTQAKKITKTEKVRVLYRKKKKNFGTMGNNLREWVCGRNMGKGMDLGKK
jgi:hypothetical protein